MTVEPRALVVDDDPDIRELVAELLAGEGYAVVLARTGLHAFEILARTPPPQLLVVDVMMPELSGPELVQRVREFPRLAAIPVVAMSAAVRRPPPDYDFDSFLPKPFDAPALARAVQTAVLKRLAAVG